MTATFSHTPSSVTTSTPSALLGPLKIDSALPDLNPSSHGPDSFKIEFEAGVDEISIKIYTIGMQCVGSHSAAGDPSSRWQSLSMDRSLYQGLGSGPYYYVVSGRRAGVQSAPFVGKFVIIR
jgi:hypothetical protein